MFPRLFFQTRFFSFICALHQAHEVIPLRQQKNPGCLGNEWLRKPGPNALDKVKMASPAGTHAFPRHALWPHELMTMQKTWQRGFGEGAGSRSLKCSAWQSHCLCCPLSHLPCSVPHPGCTRACLLPFFHPPSLSPCSDSRSLLVLLHTPQASCFPSFGLILLSPAPISP